MKLSTGKEVYANGDIFGLTKDGGLTEGYDSRYYEDADDTLSLNPEERREIADEMIRRWLAWRDRT